MKKADKTVIFLHIPRAAGNSLAAIASRQFSPDSIYNLHWQRPEDSFTRLKSVPDEQKSKLNFIAGHMGFGIHEFLPQASTYIGYLREPVDRVISHYYSAVSRPIHYLHGKVKSESMSLKEYVTSGITNETDNGQTRLLSGLDGEKQPFGKCAEEMLKKAKDNLKERFAVIGLTEKFDETLVLLRRKLGWRNICYVKTGVNKDRSRKEKITEDTLQAIRRYNRLDIELYEYAKKLFAEHVRQEGLSFHIELWLFKITNTLCGTLIQFRKLCRAATTRVRKKILNSAKKLFTESGTQETSMRNCLRKASRAGVKPRTVIDIGAGGGTPELYKTFFEANHILIEPHDRYAPYLARCIHGLKSADYVIRPVSDVPGKAIEGYDDISHPYGKLPYTTVTVDEICRSRNTKGPYLLKIYAPGRERDILKSAKNTLKNTCLVILAPLSADISRRNSIMHDCIRYMDERGFYLGDAENNYMVFRR